MSPEAAPRRLFHLVELGLRARDLPAMARFYQEVVGLELVRSFPGHIFLKAGALDSPLGRSEHPQLFVLFDRKVPLDTTRTTLDHFAFEIALEEYEAEKARLESLGATVHTKEFGWMHGRSLFFDDPEGNTIEFIAHDSAVTE